MLKHVKNFFLFQRCPGPDWRTGKRAAFWIWNLGFVLLSSVGIGFVSLLLAVGPYPLDYMDGYWACPLIPVLNLLPVVFLGLLFYALTRRPVVSYALNCLVVLGLSIANFFKLMFRDDPLMFTDLTIVREAVGMLGNYHLFISKKLGACLWAVAAGFLFMLLFVRGRLPRRGQMTGVTALLGVSGCLLSYLLCTNTTIYNQYAAYFEAVEHRWSATEQYIARGFLYPFLYSTNSTANQVPPGYREQDAAVLLDRYEDADIPEDKKVNLMCIMLEAYNDFTRLGAPELARDVYEVWHQLEDEGYSGNLVTNIFAGGTVDTERSFLTGYSHLPEFRGATNSYAWYFREQGYQVGGMHPSFQWFYNRVNINKHLGFPWYLYVENYFLPYTNGKVGLDPVFFPLLIEKYEEMKEEDQPIFTFSVTYQGHGPYEKKQCWWGEPEKFVVNDRGYTEEQHNILANYFASLENTNEYLKQLTDYLREDEEPVVLVLFGDHNPWMGDGNSVYDAMGIDFDLSTGEGFQKYYSTRYIIWANDAARETLGKPVQGEGPDISPCFLMNEVFRQCGWEGPAYLQAMEPVMERVPVQSSAADAFFENGELTDTAGLTEEGRALVEEYNIMQYYDKHHFRYSQLEEVQ